MLFRNLLAQSNGAADSPNECPGYDTKRSEAFVMLEL